MSVRYQDYYETLGVSRTASGDEIQRAYRQLARKYHPDVNKDDDAQTRFAQVSEAYEVLKDPEKRKMYDQLGPDWKSGQEFRAPAGWDNMKVDFGRDFNGAGGFSDFFESIFGGAAAQGGGFKSASHGPRPTRPRRGPDQESRITISLADAYFGATRSVSFGRSANSGNYDVRIPPGTTTGSVIRLAGQGAPGVAGGPAGDLLLRIAIAPDPRFRIYGHDLHTVLDLTPSDAALGTKLPVETLDGDVTMNIPAGSQSGQKLRLRGKGLPTRSGDPGDILVELRIAIPKELTSEQRSVYEQLAELTEAGDRAQRAPSGG